MTAMSQLSEEDAKLASQCLDICQTLAGKSLPFSFSFNIGPDFSFSVDTRGSLNAPEEEEDPINSETRCQEERRASEEEAQCSNC